ncbi:hypothetical protein AWJ20_3724 [Sugiyamaella lignohabitans]|uniref:Uncharacterized protein n=1 Tax=Sugiyamaella lignohabitans TaxID=796027 RepID=A0A167BX00_9ASCO|nr:uncharacterized protein AWJ20_3724 [Sugiyamaella lignohabitans]ANB10930.1 hypothetical protein AWJ20_3724 [Sugiyamaella lignohabitans]
MSGSRGEANFVFRCKMCKRESSATIKLTGKTYGPDNSGKPVKVAEVDNRGLEFVEFIADGVFKCQGEESGYKFPEVNLDDGEWFDYDEKAGEEVSITEVKWEFVKA